MFPSNAIDFVEFHIFGCASFIMILRGAMVAPSLLADERNICETIVEITLNTEGSKVATTSISRSLSVLRTQNLKTLEIQGDLSPSIASTKQKK